MEGTYGQRLQAARKMAGYKTQQALGDVIGVSSKTIRNYKTGATSPDAATKATLRRLLGDFDDPGDAVESAIRRSELTDWRKAAVISEYQRHLYEQRAQAV